MEYCLIYGQQRGGPRRFDRPANRDWPASPAFARHPRPDVRGHRSAVSPLGVWPGRRPGRLRNGGERASCPGAPRRPAPRRRPRVVAVRHTTGRLRGALDGGGRPRRRGARRRHHRHQHGLSGPRGDRQAVRFRPDARPGACPVPDRCHRRCRVGAGHAQDAARLGRCHAQCRRACPACRGCRHPAHHGARPHAQPVLQRRCRLAVRATGEGRRAHPRRHQRRHRRSGHRAAGA